MTRVAVIKPEGFSYHPPLILAPGKHSLTVLALDLPPNSMFAVIGVSTFQNPMNVMGIIMGGHVRVGMEDNIYYRKGEKVKSNAQVVAWVKRIAEELNREVATVAQAREMPGLPPRPSA